jgi:sugar transferase (PEP-CTERM/EpsH1 system associated)
VKLLWVKAGGLVPPDTGGKIRSYNILCELAKLHEVTLFLFCAAHEAGAQAELRGVVKRLIAVPLDLPEAKGAGELVNYGANLFSREPYNLAKYCKPEVRERLGALLAEEKFDLLLCDFLVTAGAIPWDVSCRKVIFQHNVETVIWRRHYQVATNPLWKAVSWFEWKRMEAAERKYLQKADQVIAVSENDRRTFLKYVDANKVAVTETGVDTKFFQPGADEEIPNSLAFTGSMDWLPNEDAIVYFAEEILPLIKQRLADVTLAVVGRKPSRRLIALSAGLPEIQFTGWVEDVRPYVMKRAVYIVPLRIGGGTRLKIFEAMSMGKPVVSTSIGAEGLPVRNGEHLLLADDPAKFADLTVRLLWDAARRRQIGMAARHLVEENYSWATVSKGFAQVLEGCVARRPGS